MDDGLIYDFSERVDNPINSEQPFTTFLEEYSEMAMTTDHNDLTFYNSIENFNYQINYQDILTNSDDTLIWSEYSVENVYELLSKTYDLEIYGDPISEIANFDHQDFQKSCAIATTSMMLQSLGIEFGEQFLCDFFETSGSYDPSVGTDLSMIDETINRLSELSGGGFQATEIINFSESDLKSMLNAGNKILVGVDSCELYNDLDFALNEIGLIPGLGHAVEVTGFIESPHGSIIVVNDPGLRDGAALHIPAARFMSAAADYGYHAVKVA
jgi:hypothetical protein